MNEKMRPEEEKIRMNNYKEEYKPEIFKERIKKFLKEKNITQKELADRVGIQAAAFTKYFNGMNRPSYKNLKAMAKVLHVPEEALYSPNYFTNKEMLSKIREVREAILTENYEKHIALIEYITSIGYRVGKDYDWGTYFLSSPVDTDDAWSLGINNGLAEKIELVVKNAISDWMYTNHIMWTIQMFRRK